MSEIHVLGDVCNVSFLQFRNSRTVNGTGLKLCTQVGYHDGSCNDMLFETSECMHCCKRAAAAWNVRPHIYVHCEITLTRI